MHHNMRDGCTTRQDGVFPDEALLEIMDRWISRDRDYAVRTFLRHSRRAAKGRKARCAYTRSLQLCGELNGRVFCDLRQSRALARPIDGQLLCWHSTLLFLPSSSVENYLPQGAYN